MRVVHRIHLRGRAAERPEVRAQLKPIVGADGGGIVPFSFRFVEGDPNRDAVRTILRELGVEEADVLDALGTEREPPGGFYVESRHREFSAADLEAANHLWFVGFDPSERVWGAMGRPPSADPVIALRSIRT